MPREPLPMTLPLLPTAAGPGACGKPAPLKANSLSRLEELQQYLRQCDDQKYLNNYIKVSMGWWVLSRCRPTVPPPPRLTCCSRVSGPSPARSLSLSHLCLRRCRFLSLPSSLPAPTWT